MNYRIEVRPAGLRALKKVGHQDRARLQAAIALLGSCPRPPGATSLRGRNGFRVRIGNYRVIYMVDNDVLVVVVVTLAHRRDAYER